MEFPKKVEIGNNINLYTIKTNKFKTISINIFFHRPLDENATKNALLPLVLKRGCERFKTSQEITRELENLYGAIFDCGIGKKGERHILRFHIECINNRELDRELRITEESLKILCDIILNPVKENRVFKKEYIDQEKENLRKIIDSKINNKAQFAMTRCIENMCSGEAYSIYEYGDIEELEKIESLELFEYYNRVIKSSPVDIFVVGDVDDRFEEMVKKHFVPQREQIEQVSETKIDKQIDELKTVEDKMDVSQGKLCIGYRTNTRYDTEDYYPLVVYSNVLGGGLTSKLFVNVREKASLAYTIASRIDKFKGLMFINGGIDTEKYEKAKEIIFEQVEDMRKGNITDDELNGAIKGISTSIRSLADTHLYIVDFFLSQLISGSTHDFEQLIQRIEQVKKEEVSKIAEKIELDTIYFLSDKTLIPGPSPTSGEGSKNLKG